MASANSPRAGIRDVEDFSGVPDKASIPRVPGGRRRTTYYRKKQEGTEKQSENTGSQKNAKPLRPAGSILKGEMPNHLVRRRQSSVPHIDLNSKIETRNRRPALYNTCLSILEKEPRMRTDAECQTMLEMLRNVRFLKPLSKEQQVNLCRVMRVQEVPFAGEDIVKQGEEGNSMFIILVGSFSVSVEDIMESNDGDSQTDAVPKSTTNSSGPTTVVGYLHQGNHFGEVALNEDEPRNATVTSAENDCELLRIERDDYEMAKRIQQKLAKAKADFLHTIPFFSPLSKVEVDDIAKRCFYESLPVGSVLWTQRDEIDPLRFLPIVHHGEILVVQRIALRKLATKKPRWQKTKMNRRRASISFRSTVDRGKLASLPENMKNFGLCSMSIKSFFLDEAMLCKREDDRIRKATLIPITHVEVLWLSHFYWKQLVLENKKLIDNIPKWLFHYPTVASVTSLYAESTMWGQFKKKLMEDVVRMSPRSQADLSALRGTSSLTKMIDKQLEKTNMYACLPREHQPDISLQFRLPQDRTKFMLNKSLGNDEWCSDASGPPTVPVYKYFPDDRITPENATSEGVAKFNGIFNTENPIGSPRSPPGFRTRSRLNFITEEGQHSSK